MPTVRLTFDLRSMGQMVSHAKLLLSTYQKKTDYRPEVPEVAEGTQVSPSGAHW